MSRLIYFLLMLLVSVHSQWSARAPVNETTWNTFFSTRSVQLDDLIPVRPDATDRIRPLVALPDAVDWRPTLGPARDQGECGSCWAFAAVAGLEHAVYQSSGVHVDLSEQHLVDCSWLYGNRGCQGGRLAGTLRYLTRASVCSETQYPYTALGLRQPPSCRTLSRTCVTTPRVQRLVPVKSERALQEALVQGPVVIAMHANAVFHTYANGVYDGPCSGFVNHAVLLVGYNTSSTGVPYWVIRNSWGADWGEDGYVRIVRNRRWCRIGDYVGYQIAQIVR